MLSWLYVDQFLSAPAGSTFNSIKVDYKVTTQSLETAALAAIQDSRPTAQRDAGVCGLDEAPGTKVTVATEKPQQLSPDTPYFWYEASGEVKHRWAHEFVESELNSPLDESGGYYFLQRAAKSLVSHTDRYALALVGGHPRVIDLKAEKFVTTTLEAYKSLTLNRWYPVYNKEYVKTKEIMTLGQLWSKFPRRQNFIDGVTFAPPTKMHKPHVDPLTTYNIFQGFNIRPSDGGGYARFREHLHDMVCQGDPDRFNFVMTWFADILQNPGRKTGSAMIFRGEEGVGKSLVGEQFAKLLGDRYAIVASTERHVLGNFNSHLSYALFCQVEEALFAGSKGFGTLKQLVSGERMPIELKGVDVVMVPNFTRFLMCSNESWVVPAGADARRWFVTDVCNLKKGDAAYFDAIIEEMDAGGREAWAEELMGWTIDEGILRNPPDTEELAKQRLNSFSPPEQFFIDLLLEGSTDLFPQSGTEPDYPIASKFSDTLYERYENAMQKRGARYDMNRSKFKTAMEKIFALRCQQKKVKGENARRFVVPPIDVLKAQVAERLKIGEDALR